MTSTPTTTPADPRVLSGHRQAARGGLATALPKFLRRHALHGETGEGFEAVRRRYDLPAGVQVVLALGFAIPIICIVIARHGG